MISCIGSKWVSKNSWYALTKTDDAKHKYNNTKNQVFHFTGRSNIQS